MSDARTFGRCEVEVGGVTIEVDAVVEWLSDDAPPAVVEVKWLARQDGEALGSEVLRLDLREIAVGVVIAATRDPTQFMLAPGGLPTYWGDESGRWRIAARTVRAAAAEHGRLRWTPTLDRWLVETWSEVLDAGGTAQDIADEIGTTPNRVSARLSELRKRWGEEVVPKGRPGRPVNPEEGHHDTA